jgi:hypothetical protein
VSYTIDLGTREIVFRFSGIQLQPSSTNLDASQGYVTYSIKENPNLPLNSVIENTAYIYFDFNPAIITNTTFNINGFVGQEELAQQEVVVYPNPSSGIFTISSLEQGYVKIYSLDGQFIFNQDLAVSTSIDLSQLKPGIYLLCGQNKSVQFVKKITLVK